MAHKGFLGVRGEERVSRVKEDLYWAIKTGCFGGFGEIEAKTMRGEGRGI